MSDDVSAAASQAISSASLVGRAVGAPSGPPAISDSERGRSGQWPTIQPLYRRRTLPMIRSWMRRSLSVDHRTLLSVAGVCLAATVAPGQQSAGIRVFTSAQAVAGRVAYEKSCGRRHTLTLTGRRGNPDERPAVNSDADRKFIADFDNRVPLLAGKDFLQRWGSKIAAQPVARFRQAEFSFKEAGIADDEDIVRITAYVLQVNGARPGSQALTRGTATTINSVVE